MDISFRGEFMRCQPALDIDARFTRKEWRALVKDGGDKPDRHLWETAVLAHLRNKWRSGDVWIERSANYRRFDSYLLPPSQLAPITAGLKLPATADEWLA